MAPALLGAQGNIACPGCGRAATVGTEAAATERNAPVPLLRGPRRSANSR